MLDAHALDGCCGVYLDVGSNIGVQVRKLFEPAHYPGSPILPVFDEHFGRSVAQRQGTTCAIGIEANPRHASRLRALEQAYNYRGWRTRFLVPYAAGTDDDGHVSFFMDQSGEAESKGTEWWASTVSHKYNRGSTSPGGSAVNVSVPTVDLARLLTRVVFPRRRPPGCSSGPSGQGSVVMKVDIEGGEYEVLPHLLARGALCKLNLVYAEFHEQPYAPAPVPGSVPASTPSSMPDEGGRRLTTSSSGSNKSTHHSFSHAPSSSHTPSSPHPHSPSSHHKDKAQAPRPAVIGDALGVPANYAASFRFLVGSLRRSMGSDCIVNVTALDDESFIADGAPLPEAPEGQPGSPLRAHGHESVSEWLFSWLGRRS